MSTTAYVMSFNPFTGKPRDPLDIASDPRGILVWDGEEPLRAAPKRVVTDRPALPDDEVMLEGMDARDLQMYDFGCRSCEAAVTRVLDGKDAGEGSVNEPWATLRRRLLGALVAANRRMGIPPGWQIERKGVGTALPYIVITAPNKWAAVVSRLDRNPAIILHMLAEALLNDKKEVS